MIHHKTTFAALSALLLLCSAVYAQTPPRRGFGPRPEVGLRRQPPVLAEANVDLQDFLQRVAASSHKRFLIDRRVGQRIYIGGTPIEKPTYPILLSVLRDNGLAAVPTGDRIDIVPVSRVRTFDMPLVERDDSSIPDDEWVTRIITVKKVNAGSLVPILRPLMPVAAHLAALPENATDNKVNKLIIVDRYGNVRRITAIVDVLTR